MRPSAPFDILEIRFERRHVEVFDTGSKCCRCLVKSQPPGTRSHFTADGSLIGKMKNIREARLCMHLLRIDLKFHMRETELPSLKYLKRIKGPY